MPQTGALGLSYDFCASLDSRPEFKLLARRSKLQISAVLLDRVALHGVAVGTLCTLDDYLVAFLHWRAKLLRNSKAQERCGDREMHDAFCRTLRLGQQHPDSKSSGLHNSWTSICYHIYASLLQERLPYIPLGNQLADYASARD